MNILCSPEEAKAQLSHFADSPFRVFQEDAIKFVMESDRKYKVIKARTGAGKSLISMVCGVMAGDLTYLVQSKFLQTQIVQDFPSITSVWGRSNYPCINDSAKNCDECLSTKANPCPRKSNCLYYVAKQKAIDAQYRIFNFQYFLSEIQHVGRFSGNKFTVIDEADALENCLSDNISLVFTERSLFRLGLESGPYRKTASSKDGLSSWKSFGEEALYRSTKMADDIQQEIDSLGNDNDELRLQKIKDRETFVHISERCKIFINNMDRNWLFEEIPRFGSNQGRIIFKPTWLSEELANLYLWRHSESFTLVSATFLPVPILARQLGLDPDEIDFKELPSTFDPERSPVHIWPVADVVSKNLDVAIPKLIEAIKKILEIHKGERGLIHAVSWKLCNQIMEGVNSPRLYTHTSQDRQEVMNDFMDENGSYPSDACLVSPSAERGLDLKDDKCRWVVIIKCPYLNVGDKLVSARIYSGAVGRLWFKAQALSTIEQMAGRAMRSAEDSAITYILDAQVNKLYCESPSLFSKSFQEQISFTDNGLLD
jgi:Rad3-related DNA helicase